MGGATLGPASALLVHFGALLAPAWGSPGALLSHVGPILGPASKPKTIFLAHVRAYVPPAEQSIVSETSSQHMSAMLELQGGILGPASALLVHFGALLAQ